MKSFIKSNGQPGLTRCPNFLGESSLLTPFSAVVYASSWGQKVSEDATYLDWKYYFCLSTKAVKIFPLRYSRITFSVRKPNGLICSDTLLTNIVIFS